MHQIKGGELAIIREFIDFVNAQVGVYMDCVSGFEGNTIRISRQVARESRPSKRYKKDGHDTIMYASFERPDLPDVIHHRIIRVKDFLTANDPRGFNHRQITWSIITFIFAYWDEQVRPKLAQERCVESKEITFDIMGDIRLVRNAIIHNAGVLSDSHHRRLVFLKEIVSPDQMINLSYDDFHKLLYLVKKETAKFTIKPFSDIPGSPDPDEITNIAIGNIHK